MAILRSDIIFTGSLGNLSAYRVRGSDEVILRRKGGPSKALVKNDAAFANTRRSNSEFGARSMMSKRICRVLWPLKPLADYNLAGPLNALLKPVQEQDKASVFGQRQIILSDFPAVMQGFSLTRRIVLESIVRAPITAHLDHERSQVEVLLPALIPGLNFMVPDKFPFYSFVSVAGVVPDFLFGHGRFQPTFNPETLGGPLMQETEWVSVTEPSMPTIIRFDISRLQRGFIRTLLVAAAIRFGMPGKNGAIAQPKYAGSGKVILVAKLTA